MAEKKKLPKHIQEFYDKHKASQGILDTTDHNHREAFLKAEKTIINEKGKLDYKLLKKEEKREKFLDTMLEHYMVAAKKYFNVKEGKLDDFQKDALLQAYMGFNKSSLKQALDEHKDKFNYDFFDKNIRSEHMNKMSQHLAAVVGNHLKEEHIDDVVKHTGADKIFKEINFDYKKLKVHDLGNLLGTYAANNAITKPFVKELSKKYDIKDSDVDKYYMPKAA